jgi:tetratricopeptide (TPR) repeat protein
MKLKLIFLLFLIPIILKAGTDLEKKYLQAKNSINKNEYQTIFEDLANKHKDSHFGQLSMEELAKIHILNRDYDKAISYLKKIHLKEIEDKQYWLARTYLKVGKYKEAIVSSQIYIASSENAENIETSYFIIADAYIQQRKFQKALSTLESLRTSKYINNQIPLLHFKRGNCFELMEKYEDAILCYRKLKMDFPYHQFSYLAEDYIYNLKNNKAINIDLSKLNSHRLEEPKVETKAATGEDLKIYLQVGAFSSKENAENLGKKVKKIGYNYKVFPKIKNSKQLYIVAAGSFDNDKKLKKAMQKLEKNGMKSFLIKRYD